MQEEMQNNVEVVHTCRQHIVNDMNPGNLHLFINVYNRYQDAAGPHDGRLSGSFCRSGTNMGQERRDYKINIRCSP